MVSASAPTRSPGKVTSSEPRRAGPKRRSEPPSQIRLRVRSVRSVSVSPDTGQTAAGTGARNQSVCRVPVGGSAAARDQPTVTVRRDARAGASPSAP